MKIGEVEKNFEIAPKTSKRHYKYPYAKMEIGDSFLIELESKEDIFKLRNLCGASISYWKLKTGSKYVTRSQENGMRIWRVA